MRRILKIGLWALLLLLSALGVLLYYAMGGKAPIPDGLRFEGVEVVRDGYVSAYIVDLVPPGEVVLIDSGNDVEGRAIREALRRRGLGAESVKAILLTHGDLDHVRGAHLFRAARVMALSGDVDLAEGRRVRGPRWASPTGIQVGRILSDGEVLDFAGVRIEVYALPGHTEGSAAFLARGVLFLGDAAEVSTAGRLEPGSAFFADSPENNRQSLRGLAARLSSRVGEIKAVACSHSGVLDRGLAPLTELAAQLPTKENPVLLTP